MIQLQANLRNSGCKFRCRDRESCDEAEKEIIYKSAYKTYIVLNKVIPILLLLTLIANMFLNTGILAVLVVAVIYLVTGMTYIRSSMVSKAKRIG